MSRAPRKPVTKQLPGPSLEDVSGDSAPLSAAKDLARPDIFDDAEVEEFISDLYAMRRSVVA